MRRGLFRPRAGTRPVGSAHPSPRCSPAWRPTRADLDFRELRVPFLLGVGFGVLATSSPCPGCCAARRAFVRAPSLVGIATWGGRPGVYARHPAARASGFDADRFGPQWAQALGLIAAHALFLGLADGHRRRRDALGIPRAGAAAEAAAVEALDALRRSGRSCRSAPRRKALVGIGIAMFAAQTGAAIALALAQIRPATRTSRRDGCSPCGRAASHGRRCVVAAARAAGGPAGRRDGVVHRHHRRLRRASRSPPRFAARGTHARGRPRRCAVPRRDGRRAHGAHRLGLRARPSRGCCACRRRRACCRAPADRVEIDDVGPPAAEQPAGRLPGHAPAVRRCGGAARARRGRRHRAPAAAWSKRAP